MLTFFRRIRKGLLGTGKTRKYLVYAVGEILLVMIGILLALQVNNWNEERIGKLSVKSHCQEVYSSLLADSTQLNSIINQFNSTNELSLYLWDFLNENLNEIDTGKLKTALLRAGQHISISPSVTASITAYENLVSSGAIHFIQNENLKRKLGDYYRQESQQEVNEVQRTRYANAYYDVRFNHIDPMMLRNHLNQELNLDWETVNALRYYSIDWESLKRDRDFKRILGMSLSQRPIEKTRLEGKVISLNELMELLKSEI